MGAPQSDLRSLNAAVGARIAADAKIEAAKASFWRLAGFGLAAALVGAGIGAAFFGYSYTTDNAAAAAKVANAMVAALEKARLTASGEVRLAENQTVQLKPGAEVALAPGGTVQVDPASRVTVIGSARRPEGDAAEAAKGTARPASAEQQPQTTVLRTNPFKDGAVVTEWRFGAGTTPLSQLCYFSRALEGGAPARTDIGLNGSFLAADAERPAAELSEAFKKCAWFAPPP